jgi:hypothetical protein
MGAVVANLTSCKEGEAKRLRFQSILTIEDSIDCVNVLSNAPSASNREYPGE